MNAMRGFALLHKSVAYVLASLGLGGLALGGELDVLTLVFLAGLFAASWVVEGPRLASSALQRAITIALVLLLGLQLVRGLFGEPPLGLALAWSGALQASRLANRRAAREHLQIAFLAFLHLCAATVLSTEITYALCFIGFVIVAPWMLALTHLRSEIETQHASRVDEDAASDDGDRITLPPSEKEASLQRTLSSRNLIGGPFLIGTALLSVPLFLLTAAIFVVFPRVGLGYLAFGSERGEAVSGFGNDVELGQIGRIRDDRTVILRVTPPNLPEAPPRSVELYLRGTSFDHYDGRRWTRTTSGGTPLEDFLGEYAITRTAQPESDVRVQIVLDHLDQTVVFLPEHSVAIEVPPRVVNGANRSRRITLYPGLDLRYEDDDALGLRYSAFVTRSPAHEVVRALSSEDLARYLQVPEGHDSLVTLARTWTAGATSDRARAEQIWSHLRQSPFAYSLEMQDPEGRPPLERFLLEWRTGHCEYYASAMVVLLRMVGVPARNVTGFLGGTYNSYGRYYAVTSGDAHAWVEAYLPSEGWVRFDPTPSSRGELSIGGSFFAELQALGDAAVIWWESSVVSFDMRAQGQIARNTFRFFRAQSRSARVESESATPSRMPTWGWVAMLAIVLLGAAIWRWRSRNERAADDVPDALKPLTRLLARIDRALALRGLARPPAQTFQERASLLTAQQVEGAALIQRVTSLYYEARFGGVTLNVETLRMLEAEVRALEKTKR